MILEKDAEFFGQYEQYHLRMHCEDCSLFDGESECTEGYPSEHHRRTAVYDASMPLVFCKHFELA